MPNNHGGKRAGAGRKPLPAGEKKTKNFQFWVTAEDFEILKAVGTAKLITLAKRQYKREQR